MTSLGQQSFTASASERVSSSISRFFLSYVSNGGPSPMFISVEVEDQAESCAVSAWLS